FREIWENLDRSHSASASRSRTFERSNPISEIKECPMPTILSQCRIKQFAAAALLASIGSVPAWAAAQVDTNLPIGDTPAVVVPGYGPGITAHVIEAPIARHCIPGIPCSRPVVNATVLIVDRKTRETVGTA